jgi:hypothetical protein
MVALAAGEALAAAKYCSGGLCWGTDTADVIYGTTSWDAILAGAVTTGSTPKTATMVSRRAMATIVLSMAVPATIPSMVNMAMTSS